MSASTTHSSLLGRRVRQLGEPAQLEISTAPPTSREVYAAAHVVANPLTSSAGVSNGVDHIDWDTTLQLRHDLWDLGLGVAESMDTSQRGMGLDWVGARELARRTLEAAAPRRARVVVGIATDQLASRSVTLTEIKDAYVEQLESIESLGGDVVMMASRHLARTAASAHDYADVYHHVLSHATRPVTLHWLGSVFDPQLDGYWGATDPWEAITSVRGILERDSARIRGIKVSVLDAELEKSLRAQVPADVRVFTGDDYNYVDLIAGDEHHHSDALLGAFAAVAPFASAAFRRLDADDVAGFNEILGPTEALSRLIFATPTQYYKVGVAWLAYLNGQQNHFRMLSGFETGRSLEHLASVAVEAGKIGLFTDPDFSADRAYRYFAVHGV
ncbi:DUF993 family protein [Rhodococcus qingshengii]|uniref:DUF993 family protein n=1 Tax=Rhodococcus TaxID=1827 RepID=UPI001BAF38EB|nr:DUF993 family protein [Rhodococcus qingshengii]MBS3694130.1 DUF993 family protein [Rhodococcus qingshengii]